MWAELPKGCDVGTKKNSQGYKESSIGYKLHIDAADGHLPVSCILMGIPDSKRSRIRIVAYGGNSL